MFFWLLIKKVKLRTLFKRRIRVWGKDTWQLKPKNQIEFPIFNIGNEENVSNRYCLLFILVNQIGFCSVFKFFKNIITFLYSTLLLYMKKRTFKTNLLDFLSQLIYFGFDFIADHQFHLNHSLLVNILLISLLSFAYA